MSPKVTKPKHKARSKPLKTTPFTVTTPASSSATDAFQSPLYFFGHTSGPYDFLSQHYSCRFTAPVASSLNINISSSVHSENQTFLSTEQYMMYHKALLFSDTSIASQIMATPNPSAQKALGRQVTDFDDAVWNDNRERIVEEGNWWKFVNGKANEEGKEDTEGQERLGTQKSPRERLLETGQKELVEASPRDRIWGIGFGRNNAEANRARWGLNLLGKALMRVRERLREEEANGHGNMDAEKEG